MMWVLILWVGIGGLSDKDSMTMVTHEFTSVSNCQTAGNIAKKEFEKGTKAVRFVCVQR